MTDVFSEQLLGYKHLFKVVFVSTHLMPKRLSGLIECITQNNYRTFVVWSQLVRFTQQNKLVRFRKTLWSSLKYLNYLCSFRYKCTYVTLVTSTLKVVFVMRTHLFVL